MAVNVTQSKMSDGNGLPQIVNAGSHITDASTAHALNSTFSDTEVEAALNALGTKINSILVVLESHGLVKEA